VSQNISEVILDSVKLKTKNALENKNKQNKEEKKKLMS
jgi:hypothetical protein